MTGLVRLTRQPVGWVGTGIEVSVVVVGYLHFPALQQAN
jgi:hypothetical protein